MSLKSLTEKLQKRREEAENAGPKSHAHAQEPLSQVPGSSAGPESKQSKLSTVVNKIHKKAAQLVDLMNDQDLRDDMRVIREAKLATHRIYDTKAKELIEIPDHKTRLAATAFSRSYAEGLPVARQIQIRASLETSDETMERLRASPEALRALAALQDAGVQVMAGTEPLPIDIEASIVRTVQKSGGENPPESPE